MTFKGDRYPLENYAVPVLVQKSLEGSRCSALSPAFLGEGLCPLEARAIFSDPGHNPPWIQQSSRSLGPTSYCLALPLLWSPSWVLGCSLHPLPFLVNQSPVPCPDLPWLLPLLYCVLPSHMSQAVALLLHLVFKVYFGGAWSGSGSGEIAFANNQWRSKTYTLEQQGLKYFESHPDHPS